MLNVIVSYVYEVHLLNVHNVYVFVYNLKMRYQVLHYLDKLNEVEHQNQVDILLETNQVEDELLMFDLKTIVLNLVWIY